MKTLSRRRLRIRWFGYGLLVLAIAGCGPLMRGGAPAELSGSVVDGRGRPLADIEVRLHGPRAEASAERPLLARSSTDERGMFRLGPEHGRGELLVLHGPEGVGRVRLDGKAADGLTISYPVRTTVILLHDNDLHFNFNYREAFTAEIERIRRANRNVYLLSAGDIFIRRPERWNEPTREFYARRSRKIIEQMNRSAYDVMTLGNHELDYIGPYTREALDKARFPLLAANIEVTTGLLPKPLPYAVLVTDNDLTIAVLGLSVANFEKDGVTSRCPIETAGEYLYLADRYDVLIALTHIGYRSDQRIAREVGGFEVIIGGHTHTLLHEAELVDGVLIAQAAGTPANRPNPVDPERPKYLGIVTLELANEQVVDKHGVVLTFSGGAEQGENPASDRPAVTPAATIPATQ